MLKHIPPNTVQPKTKWNFFISDSIKDQLTEPDIQEFLTTIEKLPWALKRNIGGLHEIQGLSSLAHAIEMEKSLAVADALIGTRHWASHAYIIESRCERFRIIGVAPVDCDEDDLESTRAELWGQIAIQTIIDIICDQFNVNSGAVDTYGDDVDSLVKNNIGTSKLVFPRFFRPNMDLELLLQRMRQEDPQALLWTPTYIKGHQDDKAGFDYDTAPQLIRLNIDMDELADTFLITNKHKLEPIPTQHPIPGQRATLFLSAQPITNDMHQHINLHYYGPKL